MAKKDSTKQPTTQGFEVQPGEDNANIQVEDAVMVDDQPELEQPKAKGLSIYIDLEHDSEKEPQKSKTTSIGFVLNEKEVTLATIAAKVKEYEDIKIEGFLDKKNYDLVKKAKSDLLKTRTALTNVAKNDVIDPINKWLKNYKGGLDEVSEALLAGQKKMEAKLKEIDDAFALEEQRKEEAAQARIQGRVSGLSNLGGVFSPENGTYTFPYDTGLLINSLQLKDWEDEEYNAFIDDVVASWNTEQTRLQQIEDAANAEKERILTLGSQLTDREKAVQEKQIKLRNKELTMAGAEQSGKTWVYNDQTVHADDIANLGDDEWDDLMVRITAQPDHPAIAEELTPEEEANIEQVQSHDQQHEILQATADAIPFEVEDIEFESVVAENSGLQVPLVSEMGSTVVVELLFNKEQPFIDHIFLKSILRIYPVEYELEANDGISQGDLFDAGDLADTDLKFLFIKRPK